MSTSLALMELTEEITTALDDKKVTAGVFIDLKKAFDTINHNLLLKKLAHMGLEVLLINGLLVICQTGSSMFILMNAIQIC